MIVFDTNTMTKIAIEFNFFSWDDKLM